MKELIKQNYEITKQRGLITDETATGEFMRKIFEEVRELEFDLSGGFHFYLTLYELNNHFKSAKEGISLELADIILVCFNFAHHLGIDIEQALKDKIEINRKRIVKNKK